MPSVSGVLARALLVLLVLAAAREALAQAQANVTPDLDVPPVHHFRIDSGVLVADDVHSLRRPLEGRLFGPYLGITYGAAPNVALVVDGMLYKRFSAEGGQGSESVGDFTVWGKALLGNFGGRSGYGIRFGAKLPNTPSNKDFGTNQTDFFLHVFGGVRRLEWQLSAYGGIGILERPQGEESQDDIAMGGVLATRRRGTTLLRLELEGFTQSRIYGGNLALHATWERELRRWVSVLAGGRVSHGRLYGRGELRTGLVFRF